MKFLCSNCKAKYQIPDEKIAGRTLKMDCRRCNTPITIRGDQPQPDDAEDDAPRAAQPAAAVAKGSRPATSTARPAGAASGGSSVGAHPAGAGIGARTTGRSAIGADFRRNVGGAGLGGATEAPRVTPLDQWHVAINDVPVGPMKRDEIARKIAAGAANGDSLAWREGFDDWRPIREIPELAALLRRTAHESERPPTGRTGPGRAPMGGAPRAPAPRAPAPASARASTTAGPARVAARNNVVPIGGRLGASAAPSYEPEDEASDGEATTVASAADLGLSDFGKPARDDGDIPAPSARKEPEKKDERPKAATGPFKAVPPPSAKATAPVPKPAAPVAKPIGAPAKPVSAPPVAAPAPIEDDDLGLPPVVEPEPKRPSFAPPPAAALLAPAPVVAAPVSVSPARDDRRGGLGVFAMMGIGFAMAAGAVLMYALAQRFILSPPPPTTSVVATVATIAATEVPHLAPVDDTPPPASVATVAAPPTSEAQPPPTTTASAPSTSGSHHAPTASTGTSSPPSTGARAATKAPSGDDPFAQFADDGAGPAPIATTAPAHHDTATGPTHSSAELTSEQIATVVRSGQRGLTTCWETALRQAGHVDGDVRYNMDITIGGSGRVTSVTARGPTMGNLQECLERGVRRWVFPPSATETQTTFPLLFSAQQ
jgi:predicted Zn finger-like uncharacterized protein